MQLVKAGTRTQTLLSLSHVTKVLQAVIASSTLANVVQAHCYATRKRDIHVIREAWESTLRAEEEEKVSLFVFLKVQDICWLWWLLVLL